MTAKQKKMLIRIIIASVLLVALALSPITGYLRLALFLIPYFIVGYDILLKAAKGIANGRVFDENLLMTVATLGAIAIALYDNTGDYTEAVAVMLFYQIGEWFQAYAVGKSRKNISELMDIRPDYANIEQNGQLEKVDPDEVEIGSVIVVQPGEKDAILAEFNNNEKGVEFTKQDINKIMKQAGYNVEHAVEVDQLAEDVARGALIGAPGSYFTAGQTKVTEVAGSLIGATIEQGQKFTIIPPFSRS